MLSFQVLNILSSDSYSLFEAALFCPLPATIPILMVVCAVYSFFILGPTALIGISVYVTFIPIQVLAGLCSGCCLMLASHARSLDWRAGSVSGAQAPAGGLTEVLPFLGTVTLLKKLEFESPREGARGAPPVCLGARPCLHPLVRHRNG